jgi:hypothetical protein
MKRPRKPPRAFAEALHAKLAELREHSFKRLLESGMTPEVATQICYPDPDPHEDRSKFPVILRPCPYCNGSGEAYDPQTNEGPTCPSCSGTGEDPKGPR